jgi:tRNA A-37 threonylcarbamoyl transferase component Bud32/TM2 domain-containing membrane protein YozV
MKMMFEPVLAEPMGGWELIFILATLLCLGLLVLVAAGLAFYFIRRTEPKKTGLPPVPPPPTFPKTEVMPRKCPQCGGTLPPDAPEGLCPACLLQHGFATEGGVPPGHPSFVPPPISELAKLFPQLEILECLGRGGMGAVYKARQPRLDRLVALKILAPEKQNDLQFAERFEREARALARLNHPNIVTVFDFGEVSGRFYLLMEFVDGLTLRQLLQHGKLAPAEALNIVPKICEALQYAHEQGIVHRDIKPENILLDKQGRVKIADFGIAKIAGLEPKDFSLTGARDVMGTPHYMAPEQVEKPQTVDHRADIFSLGVVFYEMLTGELPLGKFAPPSQKVHVDVRLDEVVLHALEKEPARRYQHASQVKTAVETIAGTPAEFANAPAAAGSAAPSAFSAAPANAASDKTILPAFLLAFFFGVFGAHRFYVGKFVTAFVQLFALGTCVLLFIAYVTWSAGDGGQPAFGILPVFSICGCVIWAVIDWILILCKAFTDGQGRRITHWIHPGGSMVKPAAQTTGGEKINPPPPNFSAPVNRTGMIMAPAVALMVAASWKLLSALSAVFVLTGVSDWLGNFFGLGNLLDVWGSVAIFSVVFFRLIPGLLILFGGYQMLQRRSYAWAVAAGIISIVSCSLIGLPVGIWALIVLARSDVKSAFNCALNINSESAAHSDRFWPRLAVTVTAGIVLISLIMVLIAAAWYVLARHEVRAREFTDQDLQRAGIRQEAGEFRKDFSRSFPLNADGRLSLDNVKGRIEIHGWSSNVVVIKAVIHGPTGASVDAVKINLDSDLDRASVHTEQPSSVTGFPWSWPGFKNSRRNDASVDYTLQVPQRARLADISSVNGRIVVDGVAGSIGASTVNGVMQVKDAAGSLKLSTVNGQVMADLSQLGGGQSVSLEAVNGRITLAVPDDANANFSVSTVNGGITSEFSSLPVKKEFPVGNRLNGSLGQGDASVKIDTVNGAVKIQKRPAAN